MSDVIAVKSNGIIYDLPTAQEKQISGENICYDNSPEALSVIRHSAAHLLAQAIKKLYPDAQFFVGPVVEEGFYYDFKTSATISEEDLGEIEQLMKSLAAQKHSFIKHHEKKSAALEKYAQDPLKTAVLSRISDETVSFYTQGDFEDLCRGPHVPNTKYLTNVKLTKISGAYLGGDSKNEMLTRIYGIAFADKQTLNDYIKVQEESKKRDHRKLAKDLKLFRFDDDVGAGLAIWLPAGARIRSKIERVLFDAHMKRGYEPVRGPELLKSDAWKISGHYENYGENMYFTQIDEQEYGIKPMNCLGHIKVFQSDVRSYRDLPLRFFEYGVVHRHEQSGVLHGLLRVREFTQDDSHIFCTKDQISGEIASILEFASSIMKFFGFSYSLELSTKPAKAIGDDALWDAATAAIKQSLDKFGLPYGIDEGGGAFYGPKIDIKITDALNRKWQCGTVQVDFNLPERFGLEYTDENNEKSRPVMIHRALLGSFERFIAILIEHYGGELPFSFAPTQVAIIPIADSCLAYAKEIKKELDNLSVYSSIDERNDSLNKKIRNFEKMKVPMILVLGEKEVLARTVAIRDRREKTQTTLGLDAFLQAIKEKNNGVFV
ncbi:MAG: threonine--tRNA ligase [Helicobacteraceae bacterium]